MSVNGLAPLNRRSIVDVETCAISLSRFCVTPRDSAEARTDWAMWVVSPSMAQKLPPKWEACQHRTADELQRCDCLPYLTVEGRFPYMDESRRGEVQEVRTAIANELRGRRHYRRMTQAQLIEASGISKSAIERLELGQRDMDIPQLVAITKALGVDSVAFMQSVQDALEAKV